MKLLQTGNSVNRTNCTLPLGYAGVGTLSHSSCSSDVASVRVAKTLAEVEELRDTWRLWQYHPNSDIDFYLHVVRSRPQVQRPHVVVLCRGGVPEAMLVGRLEDGSIEYKIGYKTFQSRKVRKLVFVYGGLLGSACDENCALLADEIARALSQGEADVADLHYIPATSPLFLCANQASKWSTRDYYPVLQVHRSTEIPRSAKELYNGLSPKVRKNLKWQAKKLMQEYGKIEVKCFSRTHELDEMIQDVEKVACKTYQRGLAVGFANSVEMRQRLALEAEKRWLRTYILYINETPTAFWIGVLYGNNFHSNFMGYDPAYAKYSPGTYLVIKTVESFIAGQNGCPAQIDWGLGDAQYKEVLGDCEWQEACLILCAPTFTGLRLNAVRTPFAFTDQLIKRVLQRTKVLQRVKKLWRDHARKTN